MTEIVKEFSTVDGLGAMLWKKIYTMCYAYKYKLLFENKPFEWFLVHESDKINTVEEFKNTIKQFNQLLYNPWSLIDFNKIPDKIISTRVGKGIGVTHWGPGFVEEVEFLNNAPVFNKIPYDNTNNIVIHIRRGNAIPENPRHVADGFYINLLSQISL